MKRYRVIHWDFDSRPYLLEMKIQDNWDEEVKKSHQNSKDNIIRGLIEEFGLHRFNIKCNNYIELGAKPFSIIAFHNRFYEQVRTSFVMEAYYPALTAACALGERILNHLILTLRDDYKSTPEYKSVHGKDSFDNWERPIKALENWEILLPETARAFRELKQKRNDALHFRPDVDHNDREFALSAITSLKTIIEKQFSGFGIAPWFITDIAGEVYIKKDWEANPFIKKIYLPNCFYAGYKHKIQSLMPELVVNDNFEYEEKEISDEEFTALRTQFLSSN